jgi:anthranilate phosphoribosyltransferase
MERLISGEATDEQAGAYLLALRAKGETAEEILGSARVVRDGTVRVHSGRTELLDTCGTGGDGAGTFNVSTAAALVAAGAGAPVAKHGNRSVSSRCGSADLLEACGVPLELGAEARGGPRRGGDRLLFAPGAQPAMARVGPVRRRLGVRTVST